MTSDSLHVSVIICAHTEKRYDDLCAAVASVQAQTRPAQEIWVVIDHNPALYGRVNDLWAADARVRVVENQQPRGLSGARNTAIALAQGDILAFLDDDASAAPNWLAELLPVYDDPQVAGAGGGIDPNWLGGAPRWFPVEFQWVVGCTYRGMPETIAPVRNLIGANMSFRRQVFQVAGHFTDGMGRIGALPVGCEETELCIRYRQRQTQERFMFVPQARVQHNVPAARGTFQYFRSRCYHEGRSKAQVVRLVGAGDGLSSERSYTLRTLPSGVFQGLGQALRGDLGGLGRAGAIVIGLFVTAFGYLVGKYEQHPQPTQPLVADSRP